MSVCNQCGCENLPGTLFCLECGAKLFDESQGLPTQTIQVPSQNLPQAQEEYHPPEPHHILVANLSLHIIRTGQILPLSGRSEFTLGRISEGQSIVPDVDLTHFDAYRQGVSRLHATLKISPEGYITLTDLGSSNGTRVNGAKVPPHTPHPIRHGDIIALGKLKVQALVREG
jgi:hypothetical protein